MTLRAGIRKAPLARRRRVSRKSRTYETMMKTLLLQNQQIIIQQQNMMLIVFKQFNQTNTLDVQPQLNQPLSTNNQAATQSAVPLAMLQENNQSQHQQPQHSLHQHNHLQIHSPDSDEALTALLDGNDELLANDLLYNPQTDLGQVTPYHHQQQQQLQQQQEQLNHDQQIQTPSYCSSGYNSFATPRVVEQENVVNVRQNVAKNLTSSFKSPTKSNINVQILSAPATRELKNSKAKIIQSMNISEFLRQVHHDEAPSKSSQ